MTDTDELRKRFRSSPDWSFVALATACDELAIRVEALEKKIADLEANKRGTSKLRATKNRNSKLSAQG